MNAFIALKEYCEIYLAPDKYRVKGETEDYLPTIYFISDDIITYQTFSATGNFTGAGVCDDVDEMNDHLEQEEITR